MKKYFFISALVVFAFAPIAYWFTQFSVSISKRVPNTESKPLSTTSKEVSLKKDTVVMLDTLTNSDCKTKNSLKGNTLIIDRNIGTLEIKNDQVFIDGKLISTGSRSTTVTNGNSTITMSQPINVIIKGNAGSVTTQSGDVTVTGNVTGEVSSMSGDIRCAKVGGDVSTMSGDVTYVK